MHRQHYTPPPARHPRLAAAANALVASALGLLLCLAITHWASCQGWC